MSPYQDTSGEEEAMKWTVEEETKARKSESNRKYKAANRWKTYEQQRGYMAKYNDTPKGKYVNHKYRARGRGIPFLLTFEEWWGLWKYYWHMKDGTGNLHMCRTGDEGGYELGNVRIDTRANNIRERYWK